MTNSPEKLNQGPENGVEASRAAGERLEELNNKEKSAERSVENVERTEARARQEALESAVSVEAGGAEKKRGGEPTAAPVHRGPIGKKQKAASYKKTMSHIQAELPPVERAFSKVIHNKAVEKTSDVVGSTVARPNVFLYGAIFAFAFTLIFYVIAKTYGYSLSGFESIGAFVIGGIFGIIYDYMRLLITGKRS